MANRAWLIQGLDGLNPIFQTRLSMVVSEKKVCALLQQLAARHLSVDEILSGSIRRNMKGYRPLLEVKRDPGRRVVYYCGENPHYVAGVFTEQEFKEMGLNDPGRSIANTKKPGNREATRFNSF